MFFWSYVDKIYEKKLCTKVLKEVLVYLLVPERDNNVQFTDFTYTYI